MRTIFLFAFICMTFATRAQWTYKGLGGILTHQLTIENDTVFASTSNGLYKKYIFSNDTSWQQVSFNGTEVLNTLFLDQNECLLLVSTDPMLHKAVLYKSTNRGVSSSLFLPDTVYYGYPNLAHMAKSLNGKDTIYLLSHGKKTYNGGQSWQPLAPLGQYAGGNFVYVNPKKTSEVFTGGENMIFAASLERSTDYGQNWAGVDCSSVFAGDNAFEVMHIVGDYWYASGEGIVVKKHKDSTTWVQLLNVYSNPVWALYMFGFDFSPANDHYMYVSGDSYDNDKLKLLKSSTQGATWDSASYTMPGQTRYGVNDLKVQHVWGEDRVWMGGFGVFTYGQGVPPPLSVPGTGKGDLEAKLYPNPAKDVLNISIPGAKSNNVTIAIMDVLGVMIWEGNSSNGKVTIPVEGWATGSYIIRLNTYEKQQVLRFIKQ